MVYVLDRDLHRGRADANWRDRTMDVRRVQIGVVRDGQQVVWDTQRPGHVWCRVLTGDAATGEKSYFCKVAPVFGAYAYVDRDVDGILKLLRTDDRANVEVFGARAVTLSTPPPDLSTRTSAAYDRVAAHRLDILRARPTVPASLRLQYSGGMVAHNGAHYWVPRGLTDDLTSHVPGSGKRLCVIGLDMPAKELVYADGPTVALSTPLAEADAAAVTLTGSGTVIPLWAVTLRAGQSSIAETDIIPVQPFLTTPAGAAGASAFTDLSDTPSAYTGDGGKYVRVSAGADGLEFVAGAPTGAEDFTDLADVPSTYVDQGGKVVAVTVAEDGLEFIDAPTGVDGTWADWTPTFKVGASTLALHANTVCRYVRLGDLVIVRGMIMGASGSYTGVFEVGGLPVDIASGTVHGFGVARFINQGTGFYDLAPVRVNGTTIRFNAINAYTAYSGTFNTAENDELDFTLTYEAESES